MDGQRVPRRVPPFPRREPALISGLPRALHDRIMHAVVGGPVHWDAALRERMIDGLWERDEPMGRLVDWMFATDAKQGKALFEQALEQGIESVPDAPEELRAFFARIDRRPKWVDMAKVRRGARAVNAIGPMAVYIGRDMSIMGGYLLAGFNEQLMMTGALHKGSGRRFAETATWGADTVSPDGLERFGAGFKSTIRVRMVHALVNRALERNPKWDAAMWGLPINQTDMLATILGIALVAFASRLLGVPITRDECDAVIHHGRYVAWLLGVKDEFLFDSVHDAIRLLMHAVSTHPRGGESARLLAQSLAAEPLTRHYAHFQWLRRRFEHSKHLSMSRFLVGKKGLAKLGVPTILPWYPMLTIPGRFVWQAVHRALPGGYRRLIERGRQEQLRLIEIFHEGARSAGGIIKPDTSHPAHV
ncbi:DUF2236 domain-containing protein [Pendulispora brunnea]|uniref:DUF2236 domain-containing protein n=1 Tax=Pendulispora brunnea TaxID=2905690 RepID=A0ABZ2KA90_9BACT